jgi:CheY-like chemotaxis protein
MLDLHEDLDLAAIDRDDAMQVVSIVADNACEAMPEGGVITIRTANVTGSVAGGPGALRPMLEVRDTGSGMTSEVMSHLFEPFFTTKSGEKLAGLGLSTACAIVRHSGGDLRVWSEPGTGTTVEMHLRGRGRAATARPAPIPRSGPRTVLVVDDEEGIRQIARRVLESKGYRVILAADGPAALAVEATYDGPIDLLLTDMTMPGMDGHELARQLSVRRPDVRVLLMTGYADEPRDEATRMQKPFTPIQLAEAVAAAFDG